MSGKPHLPTELLSLRVIGYVRSAREQPATTPIQSLRNEHEEARLIMLPEFTTGLEGLGDFDYAWLISGLHLGIAPAPDLHVVPFMLGHTGERLGVRHATSEPAQPAGAQRGAHPGRQRRRDPLQRRRPLRRHPRCSASNPGNSTWTSSATTAGQRPWKRSAEAGTSGPEWRSVLNSCRTTARIGRPS